MKRFFIAVAAVAALVVLPSTEAQAARRYYRSNYTYNNNYSYNNSGYNRSASPFGRLMEMERAKNAWLRSTFMGY